MFVGSGSISFEGSSIKSRRLLKWRRQHILYTDPARSLKEQLRSGDATGRQRVTSLRGQICSETPPTVFTSHFIRRHLYTNESLLPVALRSSDLDCDKKLSVKATNANFHPLGMGLAHLRGVGMKETIPTRKECSQERIGGRAE